MVFRELQLTRPVGYICAYQQAHVTKFSSAASNHDNENTHHLINGQHTRGHCPRDVPWKCEGVEAGMEVGMSDKGELYLHQSYFAFLTAFG